MPARRHAAWPRAAAAAAAAGCYPGNVLSPRMQAQHTLRLSLQWSQSQSAAPSPLAGNVHCLACEASGEGAGLADQENAPMAAGLHRLETASIAARWAKIRGLRRQVLHLATSLGGPTVVCSTEAAAIAPLLHGHLILHLVQPRSGCVSEH